MFRAVFSNLCMFLATMAMALAQSTPVTTPRPVTSATTNDQIPVESKVPNSPDSAPAQDSTSLTLVKNFPVEYPATAQTSNTQGSVVLKIAVGENGDVETVDVVSGTPVLAEAAASAAKQWKFQPFIRNGKPKKASTNAEIKFSIADGKCTNGVKQASVTTPFDHIVTLSPNDLKQYLCKKVPDVASPLAQTARVSGDVVMAIMIGKDGNVLNMRIVKSASPMLVQTAIDAVKQRRYRPYIVSGEPVIVDTIITITYY